MNYRDRKGIIMNLPSNVKEYESSCDFFVNYKRSRFLHDCLNKKILLYMRRCGHYNNVYCEYDNIYVDEFRISFEGRRGNGVIFKIRNLCGDNPIAVTIENNIPETLAYYINNWSRL